MEIVCEITMNGVNVANPPTIKTECVTFMDMLPFEVIDQVMQPKTCLSSVQPSIVHPIAHRSDPLGRKRRSSSSSSSSSDTDCESDAECVVARSRSRQTKVQRKELHALKVQEQRIRIQIAEELLKREKFKTQTLLRRF